jgi:hypothetical protein
MLEYVLGVTYGASLNFTNILQLPNIIIGTCTPLSTISQAAVEEFGAIDFITITIALCVLFCKISHRYSTEIVPNTMAHLVVR